MPYFSRVSRERLETCDDRIIKVFTKLIETIDFSVLCGFRNQEDQEHAFKNGATRLHFPNSRHNAYPSEAIDIAPYWKESPHIRWGAVHEWAQYPELKDQYQTFAEYNNACLQAFTILAEHAMNIAKEMDVELVWGGSWKSLRDYPHLEIKED